METTRSDSGGLPGRYAYLSEVVRKYTVSGGSVEEACQLAERLEPWQIEELAEAYRELARRDDVHALSAWLNVRAGESSKAYDAWLRVRRERERERRGPEGPQEDPGPESEPRGMQLFYLFDELARKGVMPFRTREVEYSPPPVVLDWSKLPERLSYLRGPAMRYGRAQFVEDRERIARDITPEQYEDLLVVATRLRASGDEELLDQWLGQYSIAEHEEASLTYWLLLLVLDVIPADRPSSAMGLDWRKLPRGLRHLAGLAEAYGQYRTPAARAELVRELSDEHRRKRRWWRVWRRFPWLKDVTRYEWLSSLASATRGTTFRRARAWAERFPPDRHPESALLSAFLALLDEHFRRKRR